MKQHPGLSPSLTDPLPPASAPVCPLLQALGPVTDAGVAVKQHLGLFPNVRITANKAASGSSGSSASASGSVNVAKAVSFMPHISVTSGAPVAVSHGTHNMQFKIGGRKLAQACDAQARVSVLLLHWQLTQLWCADAHIDALVT